MTPSLPILHDTSLFVGLDDDALADVAARGQLRTEERQGYVFHEGMDAARVYVVMEGQVRILQTSAAGHQVVLRVVGPSQFFGAVAALGAAVYPASAQALVDSVVLGWDGPTLSHLMERHPAIARNALAYMAQRLGELQNRYRELATERVEQRIARALLRLVRHAGRRVDAGVEINMPVSRQHLAELTGTSLFTVSRIMSQWEGEGLVRSGRERIIITSPHGIVRIAEDLPDDPDPSRDIIGTTD